MDKKKSILLCLIVCVLTVSLCSCGNKNEDHTAMYGETIDSLEDNEFFAIIETNTSSPVLLITSQDYVYDDVSGNRAALCCDVYYAIGEEVKKVGTVESFGTAYPVSYDNTGIYTASGHAMHRFEMDENAGKIVLAESISEQFDENGNASYTLEKAGKKETITEEDYYRAFEKYSEAVVVNFADAKSGT